MRQLHIPVPEQRPWQLRADQELQEGRAPGDQVQGGVLEQGWQVLQTPRPDHLVVQVDWTAEIKSFVLSLWGVLKKSLSNGRDRNRQFVNYIIEYSLGTRSVKSMSSNTNKQTVSVYRRIDSKPMDNLDKVWKIMWLYIMVLPYPYLIPISWKVTLLFRTTHVSVSWEEVVLRWFTWWDDAKMAIFMRENINGSPTTRSGTG